ncbi:hypothetical protein J1770_gp66 [Gordonia phage EMoore]|uniref:Uncharacterized protein n=1 Tax=Gordonia phage EMoore TaxID=2656534 RepID=A0A649VUA9_9CAUD|nr:hypothetical protein J1770_gp66 [Gordonia phage EMoore]QGJ95851.1 hypothetical protein SEA_EMOORE_66 [Gordonia phage EMoore]
MNRPIVPRWLYDEAERRGYDMHPFVRYNPDMPVPRTIEPRICRRRAISSLPNTLHLMRAPMQRRVPRWALPPRGSLTGPAATMAAITARVHLMRHAAVWRGGVYADWLADVGRMVADDAAGRRRAVATDEVAALVALDFRSSTMTDLEHWVINSQTSTIADLIAFDDQPREPATVWRNPWLPAAAPWPFL